MSKYFRYLTIGLVIGILILAAYFLLRSPFESPSIPRIAIDHLSEDKTISVDEVVLVSAQAFDPDGISQVELWVNGQLLSAQTNPDPSSENSFGSTQVWKPEAPGFFNVFVRAYDTEEYVGESETLTLEAVEGPTKSGETITGYIATEEETLESVAELFQTSVEDLESLNPDIDDGNIAPGQNVYVPRVDQPGEGEDESNITSVAPAGAAQGTQGSAKQAQPASGPAWSAILGSGGVGSIIEKVQTICRQLPFVCNLPSSSQLPPNSPNNLGALSSEMCKVEVRWTDGSNDEDGFQVVRINTANLDVESIIARLDDNPGEGEDLFFVDEIFMPGDYIYYVQSHNAAGTTSSLPSAPVHVECNQPLGDLFPVKVEMVEMQTNSDIQLLHCYIAISNAPYRRVPSDSGQLNSVNGLANISDHLGGDKSILILVNPSEPLSIAVDCVEHIRPQSIRGVLQGSPHVEDIGNFTNVHPTAEWDGRLLTGNSSMGSYSITYRIEPRDAGALMTGIHRFEDARIPAPEIVGTFDWWFECNQRGSDYPDCVEHEESGLAWEWLPPSDAEGSEDHIFRLYARGMDQDEATLIYESDRMPVMYADRNNFGPIVDDREVCSTFPANGTDRSGRRSFHNLYYSVEVEYYTSYHASVISPRSEEYYINQWCDQGVAMEVTLIDLVIHDIDDGFTFFAGSPEGQVYGLLDVPYRIQWNTHPLGQEYDLAVGPPPYTQTVTDSTYSWDRMWLAVSSDWISDGVGNWQRPEGFQQNNTKYYVPYFNNNVGVDLNYHFKEHDVGSSDDFLCGGFHPFVSGSEEDWLDTEETISIRGKGFDGECTVTIHLRGIRVDEIP